MIQGSANWKQTYPGAMVGLMAMDGVINPSGHPGLEKIKTQFEDDTRRDYGGMSRQMLEDLPFFKPYVAYYKLFNKTSHVLLQLESIANKGRSLPRVAALVEAMFVAELKNGLLTAGHDANLLATPLILDAAVGNERYTLLNGQEQNLKTGDMFISDQQGILSSIIYGPDRRTPISAATKNVIFTVYAPVGIGEDRLIKHLEDIRRNVEMVSPDAKMSGLEMIKAE